MKVTIENSFIESMFYNNALLERFPFLKEASRRKGGQINPPPCCPGKGSADYNAIKSAIANMGAEDKADFKRLINAETVKVIYKVGNGVAENTF